MSSTARCRYPGGLPSFDVYTRPAVGGKRRGRQSDKGAPAALPACTFLDLFQALCVSRPTVVSFTTAVMRGLLVLLMVLVWPWPLAAAPVAVRFAEGVTHGFLLLRTVDGGLIASGDLLQVGRGGKVESRMVFRFKDGSLLDETVEFTQQRVFAMQSYHLVQRGPAFAEDTEISLQRASGKYYVKTKSHKDGREEAIDGTLELPADVYNGMVLTVVKNLSRGASATVHMVAFTPSPCSMNFDRAATSI